MSFLDAVFFFLLVGCLGVYWSFEAREKKRAALFVISLGSLAFYAWYIPLLSFLLIGSSLVAFLVAILIERTQTRQSRLFLTTLSIALLISPLLYFKYSVFILSWFGISQASILLPLAISFYTFQNLSYVVDVYRRELNASKSYLEYFSYLSFFPQLVAGPIVKASSFLPQIHFKKQMMWQEGAFFILSGYAKKAVFADHLAMIADSSFRDPNAAGSLALVLGALAYALQIYFDFSGYSDIAIGLGKWFGYNLPENFRFPYSATSLRDFWRRWHITLSTWLRDYLYIPLGGSRYGLKRMMGSLLVTMILGGLWHGAAWNYVLWGASHGLLLCLERFIVFRPAGIWVLVFKHFGRFWTWLAVGALWIVFRSTSLESCFAYFSGMISFRESDIPNHWFLNLVISLLALIIFSKVYQRCLDWWKRSDSLLIGCIAGILAMLILVFKAEQNAFIYFVF